jgi:hypothetical protein
VRPSGPQSFAVDIDPAWSIGGVPNGGYTLAMLTRAALAVAGHPDPLAVSGHFTRPPAFGPAEVRVERVKSGRRTSTVRASLWQNDVVCLDAIVSAGAVPDPASGEDVTSFAGRRPPALPPPEQCVVNDRGPFQVALLDVVEERLDPATLPFGRGDDGSVVPSPTGEPVLRGWLRLADGSAPDLLFLLLAVDAMPPTVFNLGHFSWAPTVELTVLLRGRPSPGWLAAEASTQLVSGGWFDEEAMIWDSAGHLVVESRQLALIGRG